MTDRDPFGSALVRGGFSHNTFLGRVFPWWVNKYSFWADRYAYKFSFSGSTIFTIPTISGLWADVYVEYRVARADPDMYEREQMLKPESRDKHASFLETDLQQWLEENGHFAVLEYPTSSDSTWLAGEKPGDRFPGQRSLRGALHRYERGEDGSTTITRDSMALDACKEVVKSLRETLGCKITNVSNMAVGMWRDKTLQRNLALITPDVIEAYESEKPYGRLLENWLVKCIADGNELLRKYAASIFVEGNLQLKVQPVENGFHISWEQQKNIWPVGPGRVLGYRLSGGLAADIESVEAKGTVIANSTSENGTVVDLVEPGETAYYAFFVNTNARITDQAGFLGFFKAWHFEERKHSFCGFSRTRQTDEVADAIANAKKQAELQDAQDKTRSRVDKEKARIMETAELSTFRVEQLAALAKEKAEMKEYLKENLKEVPPDLVEDVLGGVDGIYERRESEIDT